MTADTLWTLVVAATITLYAACALIAVRQVIRAAFRWAEREVERNVQTALREQADDFGEPTRADVEAGDYWQNWSLFDAPEFSDCPIYAEMRREADVLFAAEVLATIDELPEVRHG